MRTNFNDVVVSNGIINCELTAPYYILKEFVARSGRDLKDDDLIKLIIENDLFANELGDTKVLGDTRLHFSILISEYRKNPTPNTFGILKNNFPLGLSGKINVVISYDELYKLYEQHRFDNDDNWYHICAEMLEFPEFVDIFGIVE